MFRQILQCADVEALAGLVASWGHPCEAALVAARQCEAEQGQRMQLMLREQMELRAGRSWSEWIDQMQDCSCDPSWHFEFSRENEVMSRLRRHPLLSDYLGGEDPITIPADTVVAEQSSCTGEPSDLVGGGLGPNWENRGESDSDPRCPVCSTDAVSWLDSRDPPVGGRCYDCNFVCRPIPNFYTAPLAEYEEDEEYDEGIDEELDDWLRARANNPWDDTPCPVGELDLRDELVPRFHRLF